MAIHQAGPRHRNTDLPEIVGAVVPTQQDCSRCGRRLTRPYQQFPEGAAVEVTDRFTAILLDGVPDCVPDNNWKEATK